MGWLSDDLCRHEGYLAMEFADGVRAGGSSAAGAIVMQYDAKGNYTGQDEIRPYDAVVGWRLVCDCIPASVSNDQLAQDGFFGRRQEWIGPLWERVSSKAEEDVAARRIYADPDVGVGIHVDDRDDVETAARAAWRSLHVDADLTIAAVGSAAHAAAVARRDLDQAVEAARAAGASWADIGQAAGMSRQSAHERWGR
ncbi:MAG TPA: hypothetical protein VGJ44_27135 [Kribbellaceae bacterium]|jgi:hypothetical protein